MGSAGGMVGSCGLPKVRCACGGSKDGGIRASNGVNYKFHLLVFGSRFLVLGSSGWVRES